MSSRHANHFENPSPVFLWFYSLYGGFITRKPYEKLLKEMNLNGSEQVLEFGSGVGSLGKKIASSLTNEGQLVCIDVSDKFLAKTKKKLRKHENVTFILGEISEVDMAIYSFDFIVATWVLHHVKKSMLEPSIRKFKETLKPNGKIFVIEFPDSHQKRKDFTQEKLLDNFTKEGFIHRTVFVGKRGILYEFSLPVI